MSQYQCKFKDITKVQDAEGYVNSLLSKVQRTTPTVVRRHYATTRIRKFYLRKVRYMTQLCEERFGKILEEFPKRDELHPFYRSLFDINYERDHYKVALGQINTLKSQCVKFGADYSKLLKYGDSLYRCKQLKKACLGRMVTVIKKQDKNFKFLEDVRQHITRLPSIDPKTRTVMLAGAPNAGKSSFMDLVSNARPEVHSYAFTTKSLYVGHFEHDYSRYQVIDSPGMLDRPIDSMNTIEMQSIAALTHVECAVVFFLDVSETCDMSVENQLSVLECVHPLFDRRPFVIACNKSDLMSLKQLETDEPTKFAAIKKYADKGVPVFEISTATKEGVQTLKEEMCKRMMEYCINKKAATGGVEKVLNRVYVAQPKSDGKARPSVVPPSVQRLLQQRQFYDKITDHDSTAKFETHVEEEQREFYVVDYNKNKMLENDDWKYDKIPVIKDGKNIADFMSENLEEKLSILLKEEADREAAHYYSDDPDDEYTEQDKGFLNLAKEISDQIKIDSFNRRLDSGAGIRPVNRTSRARTRERTTSALRATLEGVGVDMSRSGSASFSNAKAVKRTRSVSAVAGEERRDGSQAPSKRMRLAAAEEKRARSKSVPRGEVGMPDAAKRAEQAKRLKKDFKKQQLKGQRVPSDRHIVDLKPKHLFAGKRGIGSNQRR